MSSHTAHGRYTLVYHHRDGALHGVSDDGLSDALRAAEQYNNADRGSGGRWAVHEIGSEVSPHASLDARDVEAELRAREHRRGTEGSR